MIVLGIESSCDETAAALVNDKREILAESLLSQTDAHRPYGGVVPEIAARAHLENADDQVRRAMQGAGLEFSQLDGVAATAGPGLIGGVMVGIMTAKAIAAVHDLPFMAVNHLEGHALSARVTDGVEFPYLLLLVSGGHCQLLVVEAVGQYKRLGTTIDDSLGEAFDKTAKMLGLGYPGGPAVEQAAATGDAQRFALPRPLRGRPGCHFSFSGLKTAVRQTILALPEGPLRETDVADLCASFQAAAGDVLRDRCARAIRMVRESHPEITALVVAGGVAANTYLRGELSALANDQGMELVAPPQRLCTDNGTMIAWAGLERLREGLTDGLDFKPRPRWPLDPDAPTAAGAGVKA
ncbi:MAG: tRNA (adenosine(37)-N6)-threonylcarbamoyltransferase complex transferase subunit TsaD [Rhodospirillales bacterium]|jgi:N6-L-threonylcarbamoyladenine synthase|nr:tRNA (adenosine(37)-N6)-threonylcarbamoyltransferase complex transferase subunit TsaD [Rhodospirillales bacterium]